MTDNPAVGRDKASFDIGGQTVALLRPTDGQMLIVLSMADFADEPNINMQIEAVNNFGTVLRYLFEEDADRRFVLGSLARGDIELEDYFGLAVSMIEHWAPDEISNREERRAVAKKAAPVKKAATRVRSTRR
jgi:hypothetical protein